MATIASLKVNGSREHTIILNDDIAGYARYSSATHERRLRITIASMTHVSDIKLINLILAKRPRKV